MGMTREEGNELLRTITAEEAAFLARKIAELSDRHGLGGAIRRAMKKLRKQRKAAEARAAQGGDS